MDSGTEKFINQLTVELNKLEELGSSQIDIIIDCVKKTLDESRDFGILDYDDLELENDDFDLG